MQLAANVVLAGRFRLFRQLGRTAHGPVWLAHRFRSGTPCVIKLIGGEACHPLDAWARLEAEIETNLSLRNEHVAALYERGIWEGVPFLAMEYLEGESLRSRLDRVGRLDVAATCRLVEQVAQGLTTGHSAGIIHGDLRPDNVFLVPREDGDAVKLIDFGADLGRYDWNRIGPPLSGRETVPHYASPEKLRGFAEVDHRSDIWSLGILAFRCLTGTLPFHSDELDGLVAELALETLLSPRSVAPDLPRSIDSWWRYAMAREPNERFQSARQLAEALRGALVVDAAGLWQPWTDANASRTSATAEPVPDLWDVNLDGVESTPPLALDTPTLLPPLNPPRRGVVHGDQTPDFELAGPAASWRGLGHGHIAGVLRVAVVAVLLFGMGALGAFVRHRLRAGADVPSASVRAAMPTSITEINTAAVDREAALRPMLSSTRRLAADPAPAPVMPPSPAAAMVATGGSAETACAAAGTPAGGAPMGGTTAPGMAPSSSSTPCALGAVHSLPQRTAPRPPSVTPSRGSAGTSPNAWTTRDPARPPAVDFGF